MLVSGPRRPGSLGSIFWALRLGWEMISRRLCSLVLALGVLFSTCIFVQGQSTYGSIRASVTGPFGAVIADARVALTNLGTAERRSQPTGSDRRYSFVIPGNYRIGVEKPGFKRITQEPVVLQVQQMSKIDLSLPAGQATVTVEVTSEIPLLQPETSSLGQVVEFFTIFNHPQFGPSNGTCLTANNANFGWYQHD